MSAGKILIVGGTGVVGQRLAALLEAEVPGRVVLTSRNPERERRLPARRVEVEDRRSIDAALDGVSTVVACVRQREPHLLRAAVERGLAYTSIAPPWLPWPQTEPLRREAERTGARVVLAAGLEPGISSLMVRRAAEQVGEVQAVETALLLSLGDVYGADSMAFIFEELTEPYTLTLEGQVQEAFAFTRSRRIDFPAPVGARAAFNMPFRDQLYYPATLGAKTAIARLALDPPWLGPALFAALKLGLRRLMQRPGGSKERVRRLIDRLKQRSLGQTRFALVVEVTGSEASARATLVGERQADATAAGVAAIAEALWRGEASRPGVWLAEQAIAPEAFFARLGARGLVPVFEPPRAASRAHPAPPARPAPA